MAHPSRRLLRPSAHPSGFIVLIALLVVPITAFAPTRALSVYGFLGTSHEVMTKNVIEDLDYEFFNVAPLTRTMRQARDEIARENALCDDEKDIPSEKFLAPAHFDGESFTEGQKRVLDLKAAVVTALGESHAVAARKALGRALHTLQDFYSHTNWVEAGNTEINPILAKDDQSFTTLPKDFATCEPCIYLEGTSEKHVQCAENAKKHGEGLGTIAAMALCKPPVCNANLLTTQLTSGYYSGEVGYEKPNDSKCSHGGMFDGSARGVEGINKDSTNRRQSPHWYLHESAVRLAKEHTVQFIKDIQSKVTHRQLMLLFGVGPPLAFAIDTTGSMEDVIAQTREKALSIVQKRLGTDDEPSSYVLVSINDPSSAPVSITNNPVEFKNAISSLSARGGGDCPEYAMSGIAQAVELTGKGGNVFVYTDAAAKDIGLATKVADAVLRKGIKVHTTIFPGRCSTQSGYDLLSSVSGGKVFSLEEDEAGAITDIIGDLVRSNSVDILYVSEPSPFGGGESGGGGSSDGYKKRDSAPKSFPIPVDSTLKDVTFSISGPQSLSLTQPDGKPLSLSAPGVSSAKLSNGTLISIATPTSGIWKAIVTPPSTDDDKKSGFSLTVSGVSPLQLTSFDLLSYRGRPGHKGLFPLASAPAPGTPDVLAGATLEGKFASASFDYRTRAGGPIPAEHAPRLEPAARTSTGGPADADAGPLNVFFGNFTMPRAEFVVYAVGEDEAGAPFQRVFPGVVAAAGNGTAGNGTTSYPNSTTTMTGTGMGTGTSEYPAPTGGGSGGCECVTASGVPSACASSTARGGYTMPRPSATSSSTVVLYPGEAAAPRAATGTVWWIGALVMGGLAAVL